MKGSLRVFRVVQGQLPGNLFNFFSFFGGYKENGEVLWLVRVVHKEWTLWSLWLGDR